MQILIISPNSAANKHWNLSAKHLVLMSILFLALFASAVFFVSQKMMMPVAEYYKYALSDLNEVSHETEDNNAIFKQVVIEQVAESTVPEFYAKRLGELQAESIRLKAIAKQLANITGIDLSQYSLEKVPAQGGIEQSGSEVTAMGFESGLTSLSGSFDEHLAQLESMQQFLLVEDAIESTIPTRRPIDEGWLSSHYGNRIDPFNGKKTFHRGIDFASKDGAGIYAVAAGLVSWTGSKSGYGKTVEIDHGNGYVTRYAHSKELLVAQGDRVEKGQEIALIGSTGRSTGPHVHFELLQEGKTVNPRRFIK